VATPPGEPSPSGARSLSAVERSELAATARGLPLSWVVMYNDYTGQTSIVPLEHVAPNYAYLPSRGQDGVVEFKRRTSFRLLR
jgi:hypothetical protein